MHAEIKQVTETLLFTLNRVHVRLSAPEHSALGQIIGQVYYNTRILDLLRSTERTGYPHNGGQHTLELHCAPLDAIEMIEMIKETALEHFKLNEEQRRVASQLSYISQEIHKRRYKM
jgi:hypothetical protein